jgi:hypothetical protein
MGSMSRLRAEPFASETAFHAAASTFAPDAPGGNKRDGGERLQSIDVDAAPPHRHCDVFRTMAFAQL